MAGTSKGTIKHADNFAAEKIAANLRRAIRGMGTDDRIIIDTLTKHSLCQRQEISEKYTQIYGRSLTEDIKAVLGGHFEDVCLALLKPYDDLLVDNLYEACKTGDKYCIIETLNTHNAEELENLKALFIIKYSMEPEAYIRESFSGEVRKLLESMLARNDQEHDEDLAELEAQKLFDAGVAKSWRTEHDVFIKIIGTHSTKQMELTAQAYERISGHPLTAAIQSEFSGDLKEALVSIVLSSYNIPMYFARQLYRCMRGPGTDDKTLIRVLVTRSEIDLEDIKIAYKKKYRKELSEAVADDTSGDYQKILLKIINP